jgi:hypothetical protein
MPQLVKGGKWVYGWVVVGPKRELHIPPQAWQDYRFRVGEKVIIVPGSRRSGGFGLSTSRLMEKSFGRDQAQEWVLGDGQIDLSRRIVLPPGLGVRPGDRLLAVRGSSLALGYACRGPICEEAAKHPGLEEFGGNEND